MHTQSEIGREREESQREAETTGSKTEMCEGGGRETGQQGGDDRSSDGRRRQRRYRRSVREQKHDRDGCGRDRADHRETRTPRGR